MTDPESAKRKNDMGLTYLFILARTHERRKTKQSTKPNKVAHFQSLSIRKHIKHSESEKRQNEMRRI